MRETELKVGSRYLLRDKSWDISDFFRPDKQKAKAKVYYVPVEYEGRQIADDREFDDVNWKWVIKPKQKMFRFRDTRMDKGTYILLSVDDVRDKISNFSNK